MIETGPYLRSVMCSCFDPLLTRCDDSMFRRFFTKMNTPTCISSTHVPVRSPHSNIRALLRMSFFLVMTFGCFLLQTSNPIKALAAPTETAVLTYKANIERTGNYAHEVLLNKNNVN